MNARKEIMLSRRVWMGSWLAGLAAATGLARADESLTPSRGERAASMPVERVPSAQGLAEGLPWLDRLTWGAHAGSSAAWLRQGHSAWLKAQLEATWPPTLPASVQTVIDEMTISKEPFPELVQRMEEWRQRAKADDTAEFKAWQRELARLSDEASTRILLRSIHADQQLHDRMGWFWLNHFSVHKRNDMRLLLGDFDQALRPHALGRFRDLLGAATLHPAMLRYLNNDRNAAGHINENLARELMELHTLGVDGGYTQADVESLARVLTGLGLVRFDSTSVPPVRPAMAALDVKRGVMHFSPVRHDFSDKQLLGQKVAGRGVDEIEGVLDRLARHPATARHLSRKLAVFFVTDNPPESLVERLAARFLETDGHIREVLAWLFASPEFRASLGRQFKDPLHFTLSAVRQFCGQGGTVLNAAPLLRWLEQLGQVPFGRTTPDGYPMVESAWNGSGQLTQRFDVAREISRSASRLAQVPQGLADRLKPSAQPLMVDSSWFDQTIRPNLSKNTAAVLAQAEPGPERQALWWSSPEFMRH